LSVVVAKNQVSFTGNDLYVVSRVVEGTFPDYTQIIPKENKSEAILLKTRLCFRAKISTIFANTFNQISFNLLPAKKHFLLKLTTSTWEKTPLLLMLWLKVKI